MKGANRPCYLVVTDKTVTLNQLETEARTLMNTRIEWARHINSKLITQCHRCQRWRHATSNCNAAPRCPKCAGEHFTYTHKDKVPEKQVKCANCGGAHVTTTTPNPQNDEPASATSLFAELKKLNDKINIREAIRAIKDLNAMLSSAKTKEHKFNAMLEFSTKINDYDL
jgi:hypothetical protein